MKAIIAALLLLFIVACSSSAPLKSGVQVGAVADSGEIVQGARMALINVRTLRVVNAVANNTKGLYYFMAEPGEYVLIVAPPSGTSCADSAVEPVEIQDSSTTLVTATLRFHNCK